MVEEIATAPNWVQQWGLGAVIAVMILGGLGYIAMWSLKNIVKPAVEKGTAAQEAHLTKMSALQERVTVAVEGLLEHERAEAPVLAAIKETAAAQLAIAEEWKATGVRRDDIKTRRRARVRAGAKR